jgi:Uma2 family endonuclease
MATRPKSDLTVEDYLKHYEGAKGRYELVDGQVVKMAAETNRHAMLKGNVYFALRQATQKSKTGCTVMPDGATVRISANTAREPDVAVQCGTPIDPKSLLLSNPTIVVEVVSPSSGTIDSDYKLAEYFSVPSIMHYLIVWPEKQYCYHHKRIDNDKILTTIVRSGVIEFEPPGISISMGDIFGVVAQ